MKQYRPSYYKNFRCIAGACSDSCCIGWEIDIDDKSAAFYRSVGGDFGCRLRQNILQDENGSQFILRGERCPFLNEQNLCDIYIHLGESALCEICDQHPRYHEWFGNWKESGVGLCCEAAGRLIFSQEAATSFETVEISEEPGEAVDEEAFCSLFAARRRAIQLLQNRQLPFAQRLRLLLLYGEEVQEALDWEDWRRIREIADAYACPEEGAEEILPDCSALSPLLTFLSDLEPIDPQWPALLLRIRDQFEEVLSAQQQYHALRPQWPQDMEQLAVYFLFRYFCKALFDGDIASKTALTVSACLLIALLNGETVLRKGSFTLEDQVFTAKQFSKEIEYCIENLDALCDLLWEGRILSTTDLCALVSAIFA